MCNSIALVQNSNMDSNQLRLHHERKINDYVILKNQNFKHLTENILFIEMKYVIRKLNYLE